MTLNPSQIILLIISGINLFLSFLVVYKNRRNKVNWIFSLFLFLVGFWALSLVFLQVKKTMIWSHFAMISGILMGTTFLLFSQIFPREKQKLSRDRYLLILVPAFIFTIFVLSNLVIKDIKIVGDTIEPVLGPLYPLFMIYVVIYASVAIIILGLKYRRAKGLPKMQLKYLFLGFALFIISIILSNIILPLFKIYQLTFLGPAFSLFLVSGVAYSITRYRLMDVRLIIGRGAVYIFSFIVVITLGILLSYLDIRMGMPVPMFLAGPIMLVIGILLFPLLFRFYEKFAARYFYYTFYSYQKVLTELGEKLTGILDLGKLSNLIANTLINTMKLTKVGILLREAETETYRIHKIIGFRKENGLALTEDNFLTLFLEKTKKPLIYEELSLAIREAPQKKEELIKLQENMERFEAEACLPLLFEDKIIGIIVLGKKISGEPYSTQDVELLINLSNQSAIAFQNARFYRQVQDLSKNLEKRVKQQVKQIEKLSQMKSEFLKVVNHQLRTPVSIVKGMLSMMEEGSVKGKKLKEFTKKAYLSSERLSRILDDILTAQDLIGGEKVIEHSPCKIDEIVEREVKSLGLLAKQKKLKLTFKKSKDVFPLALANPAMIERIISRVVDNAILYTEKGEVRVSIKLEKEKDKQFIEISVKDSGVGLGKEEKKNLFKLFYRGKKATSLHPNGSGLGLFIVKKLVELHKGTIKAKSEGKNKGTTFIIRLPIVGRM